MTSDDLLTRTAGYHIVYSPEEFRQRHRRPRLPPMRLYPEIAARNSVRERTTISDQPSDADGGSSAASRRDPSSSFRVTTNFEDKSDEEEDEADRADLSSPSEFGRSSAERLTSQLLTPQEGDSESEESDNADDLYLRRNQRLLRHAMNNPERMDRRRFFPSVIEQSGNQSGANNSNRPAQGSGLIRPHARFFIQRGRSMVSLKFDPPA